MPRSCIFTVANTETIGGNFNRNGVFNVAYYYEHCDTEFKVFDGERLIVRERLEDVFEVASMSDIQQDRIVVACDIGSVCMLDGSQSPRAYFLSIPCRANRHLVPTLLNYFGRKIMLAHRDLREEVSSRIEETVVCEWHKEKTRKRRKFRKAKFNAVEDLGSLLREHDECLALEGLLEAKDEQTPQQKKEIALLRKLRKGGFTSKMRRWFDRRSHKPAGRFQPPDMDAKLAKAEEDKELDEKFGPAVSASVPVRKDDFDYRDDARKPSASSKSASKSRRKAEKSQGSAPVREIDVDDQPSIVDSEELSSTIDQFENLAKIQKDVKESIDRYGLVHSKNYEKTAHKLERVIIFGIKLAATKSYTDFLILLADFVHEMSERSWVETLLSFARGLMGEEKHTPSGWTDVLTGLSQNGYLMKVFKLVAMAISIVLAGFSNVEWDLDIFKATDFSNIKITTMWSMIVESMEWFVKVGHEAFRTKSILPLFWTSPGFAAHMSKYEQLLDRYQLYKRSRDQNDWHELYADVVKAKEQMSNFVKTMKGDATRVQLVRYVSLLSVMEYEIADKLQNIGPRVAPFGICVNGPSGVGKSAALKYFQRAALAGYGEELNEERVWNINAGAAHDDGLRNDCNVAVLDDFGNNHPDFLQTSPTDRIITITNNVRYVAKMADVESKGKISPVFKLLLVTTNVKHLNAKVFSMCPSSILRRLIHIEMEVCPEFRLPGSTMLDPDHLDVTDVHLDGPRQGKPKRNIHRFILQRYVPRVPESTSGFQTIDYKNLTGDDPEDENGIYLTLDEMERAIFLLSEQKYAGQLKLLAQNNSLPKLDVSRFAKNDHAPTGLFSALGWAIKPLSMSDPLDTILTRVGSSVWRFAYESYFPWAWSETQEDVVDAASGIAIDALHSAAKSSELWAYSNLPRSWFFGADGEHTILGRLVVRTHMRKIVLKAIFKGFSPSLLISMIVLVYWAHKSGNGFMAASLTIGVGTALLNRMIGKGVAAYCHYEDVVRAMNTNPTNLVTRYTSAAIMNRVTLGVSLVVGIVGAYKIWALAQTPSAEEKSVMPTWLGNIIRSSRGPSPSYVNMPSHQFRDTIGKNLVFVSYKNDLGNIVSSRGFLLSSNHLLAPKHIFTRDGVKNSEILGGHIRINRWLDTVKNSMSENIPSSHIRQIGNQDLVIVYLYGCFTVQNRLDLLAREPLLSGTHYLTYFTNEDDGTMTIVKTNGEVCMTGYEGAQIRGIRTNLHGKLVEFGRCGSLLVSERHSCAIQGFLFSSGSKDSGFEILDRARVDAVINDFKKDLMDHRACGKDVPEDFSDGKRDYTILHGAVHSLAKPHFKDEVCNVVHTHGATKVRFNNKSNVTKRKISDDVEEVFGCKNEYGPPMFKGVYNGKSVNPSTAYNASLAHMLEGADNVADEPLRKAVDDYLRPLLNNVGKFSPLNDFEVVNGKRGTAYVKPLNMKTSMGFPYFKGKGDYFDFDQEQGFWTMGGHIAEKYHKDLVKVKEGDRVFPVFAALLKDEAMTTKKYKVRVFYACPVVFTMLTRKYYLPIAEFLMCNRELSEIAIGMNAAGRDWDRHIQKYCKKFMTNDKQLFGLDYSKYDLKFSPNVMREAYNILIRIAERAGYSQEDLNAMKTIAQDACNPFIDWNGTLISVTTMHPSGNALTAVINSIVNLLLLRSYYYAYNVGTDFRSDIAVFAYGDDVLGSVRMEKRADFNFSGYSEYLSHINMKITPPWKDNGDGVIGFPEDRMDFLKRLSVYHEVIDYNVGAIDEDSIFKSLLWRGKIKLFDAHSVPTGNSEESVTSSVMDCALHEWALHGKTLYERRRAQLKEVLRRHPDISNNSVDVPYEERIRHIANDKLIRNGDDIDDDDC